MILLESRAKIILTQSYFSFKALVCLFEIRGFFIIHYNNLISPPKSGGKGIKIMIDKIIISTKDFMKWESNKQIENIRRTGQDHFNGHIKNIKINQNLDGCFLCGSIAKYLKGQNINPLTREEIEQALLYLQQDTGLDFSKAVIQSLEIGTSIKLKNPVTEYLQCFDGINNSKYKLFECRTCNGLESLCYRTKTGGLEFSCYDKIQEMKDKRQEIPESYKNLYVIRLELKIKNRQAIRGIFEKDLPPFELANKYIIAELQRQFSKFYKQIPKTKRTVYLDMSKAVTPAELEKLQAEAYRQEHSKELADIMKAGKDKGFLSDKTLERIRAKNKQNKGFSEKNGLIDELDDKLHTWGLY